MILPIPMLSIQSDSDSDSFAGKPNEIKVITLNPAHFHAALVHKSNIDQVDPVIHIYSEGGPDLDKHLERIEGFNSREKNPTNWKCEVFTGDDYLERMLEEKPGNVMVTAGNNRLKTEYIKKTVDHGINVLSDKPMAINKEKWELLVEAFKSAEENGVLLYDIMTERNEITSMLQRKLAQNRKLFGELRKGSVDDPAIVQKNTHHLKKTVSGNPLMRPPWYFDVLQQGEGIVDIPTHLIDLAMWCSFPGRAIDYKKDLQMIKADRSPTMITREQFEEVTGSPDFPEYLSDQIADGKLPYYCNGSMNFTLCGHHTKIVARWDYEAPAGGGDSHFATLRGTKSDLVIRQSAEQNFKSTLYVEPAEGENAAELEKALVKAVEELQGDFSGVTYEKSENGWKLEIPDKYYLGHEAHFGKVAQDFFGFLVDGKLPEWEVPNMITKYYITTQAREIVLNETNG
jgi:predicted dehydrogenase